MHFIFNTVFYLPLYNALVLLCLVLPSHSVGLAIILLTIGVRVILFPLQHRMSHTQRKLRELDGTIKAIKEKHANDNTEQARQIMALYKEHGINPMSGFIVLIIQIPILLALYWVTRGSFNFDPSLLYRFVVAPATISTNLFGLIDVSAHSYVLAALVGLSQFTQISLTLPPVAKNKTGAAPTIKDDMARSMSLQMRYVLPVLIIFISAKLPAAVSLYWITSNIFSIGHELYVRRKAKEIPGPKNLNANQAPTN
jgi:YidC/Oxa1 family membrane protein insertase